ncbi:molybdopterin dinucleotide binding domain-containing protein [Stygiolobus sp. CP850M]|uniref:molybdopterin dinucleotide binding domain-containing protein n=1 Tax=Stygiolobus sp. CP850M TaxID=3133134 RepID=UPI00307F6517
MLKLTRRDFIKLSGAVSAGIALTYMATKGSFTSKLFVESQTEEATAPQDEDVIAFSTCYMCLGRCTMQYQITANNLIRYAGGDIYGRVNNGATCPIGPTAAMHYLSPARMKYPLLRPPTVQRGTGQFIRIDWEDLYDILLNGDNAQFLQERGWKYGFKGLKQIYQCCPEKFVFVTGRDQYNPSENRYFGAMFGTPNEYEHGGFCAANVAIGAVYVAGSTYWEYGYFDDHYAKVLILSGVTQDHFPTGLRRRITMIKERGGTIILIQPDRQPNVGPISNIWVPIRPAHDGLLISSIIHELLRLHEEGMSQTPPTPYIDEEYLRWYTNAPWLVITNPDGTIDPPSASNIGLFLRVTNKNGEWTPAVMGSDGNVYAFTDIPWQNGVYPVLEYEGDLTVPVGPDTTETITVHVKSAFKLLKEQFLVDDYAPENVEAEVGYPAEEITNLAKLLGDTAMRSPVIIEAEWVDYLGRKHEEFIGRPVATYIMRGISAHTNGFNTTRLIMVLEALLGAIDTPGGYRAKYPYPKPVPDGDFWPAYEAVPDPRARITQDDVNSGEIPTVGPNGESYVGTLGGILINERVYNDGTVKVLKVQKVHYPTVITSTTNPFLYTPDMLAIDENGRPLLIDRAYSWEFPFAQHRSYNVTMWDAGFQFPYNVEFLLWHITNPYWDNSYDLDKDIRLALKQNPDGTYAIPFIAIVDTFYGNSVPFADLVLADTTFLERYGEHSTLDRPITTPDIVADSIEHPILPPLFHARPFSDVEIEIGYLLGLSAFQNPDGSPKYPNGFGDFLWKWQIAPGVGMLIAGRGQDGTECCKGDPNPNQVKLYTYPGKIPAYNYGNAQTYPGPQEFPVTNGELPPNVPKGTQKIGHALGEYELPLNIRYYRHVNMYYLQWAHSMGLVPYVKPIVVQIYSEPVARFRLAAYGMWKGYNAYFYYMYKKTGNMQYLQLAQQNANVPNDEYGSYIAKIKKIAFWPIPKWYPPLSWTSDGFDPNSFPLQTENRHTTPWFYHHWENHNPWLRPLLRFTPVFMNPSDCQKYGITDMDWVEFESWTGEKVRAMVVCDETTRPGVVWYWKARNIRPGTLAIPTNSPEATISTMFNDVYSMILPPSMGGADPQSYNNLDYDTLIGSKGPNPALLNYDPFTGKTSWGDLRFKVSAVLGKGSYTVSYGLSDPYVLTPASAPYNPPPNLQYLQYNAYKSPEEMGITWYKVNQEYYQWQQQKQVIRPQSQQSSNSS